MKAKDTVMNPEEMERGWGCAYTNHSVASDGMIEAQAEISFKAGKQKAVEFIESYLVTTVDPILGDMHHLDDREWQSVKLRLLRDIEVDGKIV